MKKYVPIACGLYDVLTLYSVHKENVKITYSSMQQDDIFHVKTGVITDIYTKEGAEYLQLGDDEPAIRLDQVTSVIKQEISH